MARRKRNRKKQEEVLVDIVEARDQAQDFLDRNQKTIFGVLTAIVVLIGGLLAYNNFFKKPRQEKAVAQLFQAEYQFGRDSFALALTNPGGGYSGILGAIDNYGGTDVANAANYYTAVSYLNLGKFDAAIAYMDDFDAAGKVMPIMKNGVLGDAWSEKNDFDKALSYYKKAASVRENEILTPYYLKKLGMLHEKLGNFAEAQKMYEKIKNKYSNSPDGRDIDKYLIRIKSKV